MRRMNHAYIFLDYDRTVFSHRTFTIPDSAYRALACAKACGHHLILDTGRVFHTAIPEHPELFEGIIFSNGMGMIKDGALLCAQFFQQSEVERVIRVMRDAGAGLALHGIYYSWNDPIAMAAWGIDPPDPQRLFFPKDHMRLLSEYGGESVNKIDFFYAKDTNRALAETALDPDWEIARVVSSATAETLGGEVTLHGINKGTGLLAYVKQAGIPVAQTIAIGDSANDIPMLEAAEVGVAMGNASDAVKRVADYVTSGIEEDGIMHAFMHLGLIEDLR